MLFATDFSIISKEELRKVKTMELKLTHEKPDEPTDKRDEATKTWSNDDVQQPILFENVQLPQIENVQLPQIEMSSHLELKMSRNLKLKMCSYLKLKMNSFLKLKMSNHLELKIFRNLKLKMCC